MTVVVITPPAPVVLPADVPGTQSDSLKEMAIAAATEVIDGPGGWLGRAIGPQTLEMRTSCAFGWFHPRGVELPYPPLIAVEAVRYIDPAGEEQTIATDSYTVSDGRLRMKSGFSWPATSGWSDAVRIRYQAGYDGTTTGDVPVRVKQAIIMAAQDLLAAGSFAGADALRSETAEDVGSWTYLAPSERSQGVSGTVEALLSGLRVYAV